MSTKTEKLGYLHQRKAADCTRCELSKTRSTVVFGEGNADADIMFVGEGPGAHEDRTGRPFVGPAGSLLDRWIEYLGLKRSDVYIANVVKCRPPQNRDPWEWEIQACVPFLRVQIAVVKPKMIVTLGRFAGGYLSGERGAAMKDLRGRMTWTWQDDKTGLSVPVVPIYHPAYVLRSGGPGGQAEAVVFADLAHVQAFLG